MNSVALELVQATKDNHGIFLAQDCISKDESPHDKTNKMNVCPVTPVKTQISLSICPVWSVFADRMKKALVLSYPLSAQQRLWSDWADAQADLSLCWAQMPFCSFCHEAAQIKNQMTSSNWNCCSTRSTDLDTLTIASYQFHDNNQILGSSRILNASI